jgi:hypothetical protein
MAAGDSGNVWSRVDSESRTEEFLVPSLASHGTVVGIAKWIQDGFEADCSNHRRLTMLKSYNLSQ